MPIEELGADPYEADYEAALTVFAQRRNTFGGPLAYRVDRLITALEDRDRLLDEGARLLWEVVYKAIEQPEWAGQRPPFPIDPNTLNDIKAYLNRIMPANMRAF